jgi:hypothetical protein
MDDIMKYLAELRDDEGSARSTNAQNNPIKVAILDTGVSPIALPQHLPLVGRSFVEDEVYTGADSHWHSPECSHGTKLAELIIRCNPLCQIYVAKVQSGPNPESVDIEAVLRVSQRYFWYRCHSLFQMLTKIQALEWVTHESNNVDIICMSWTIDSKKLESERVNKFEKAIDKAGKKALMFCALSDTGKGAKYSYPANFKPTFKISSYSMDGGVRKDSEHHRDAMYFPAEQLVIKKLAEYFDENELKPLEGSSYATALAAGIASFVLQCVQFAYHPGTQTAEQPKVVTDKLYDFKRREMGRLFEGSMADQTEKDKILVQPWRTFEDGNWKGAQESDKKKLEKLKDRLDRL